jgi:CXXX repeat peptide maturase
MMLTEMNNCNAGDTTITLAPNGKFYICPAFYYNDENDNVGNIENGLDIKNKQLYKLDHAPICRKCDAWQCRRCTWLNRKTTLEVNTPSHEQCVAAHLERNASRNLMLSLRSKGTFLPDKEEIKELTYLDPFEIATQWK